MNEELTGLLHTGIPSTCLYTTIAISILAICFVWYSKRSSNKRKMILWIILFEYLSIVFFSTILFRPPLGYLYFERVQLVPFWTYRAILTGINGVSIWDIILNIVLFTPLGFILTKLYPKMSIWLILTISFFVSFFIETSQYLFYKGVTQFDDVLHNVLGCWLGVLVSKIKVRTV